MSAVHMFIVFLIIRVQMSSSVTVVTLHMHLASHLAWWKIWTLNVNSEHINMILSYLPWLTSVDLFIFTLQYIFILHYIATDGFCVNASSGWHVLVPDRWYRDMQTLPLMVSVSLYLVDSMFLYLNCWYPCHINKAANGFFVIVCGWWHVPASDGWCPCHINLAADGSCVTVFVDDISVYQVDDIPAIQSLLLIVSV